MLTGRETATFWASREARIIGLGARKVEEIILRKMTAQDVAQILDIDRSILGRKRAASWPQKVTRYLEMYYPPLCHVAEIEGRVVGFILGDVRGWEYALPPGGWIDIMGVDPDYQGRGIGRRLLEAFVEECHRSGMKTHIIVREGDERLQNLLLSAGFHRGQLAEFET